MKRLICVECGKREFVLISWNNGKELLCDRCFEIKYYNYLKKEGLK